MSEDAEETTPNTPPPPHPMDLSLQRAQLGAINSGIGNASIQTPEALAAQEAACQAAFQRAEAERQGWEAKEARQRQESRDDTIRTAALHGALLLDYTGVTKNAASVVAAAREIEAFMRGAETA